VVATYRTGPETERLVLRAFEPEDAEALFELRTDPEVTRYTGEPPPRSLDEVRREISAYPDFERYGFGRWACVYKPDRRIIGFAGLKFLEEIGEVDLGYRFLPTYWGRGLATEAATASIDFGFRTLGLEYIIGLVMHENTASIRVLEKVGMELEGPFEYFGEEVLRYGRSLAANAAR
jgi:ribosomal-protein-alanine N-acetyltransferase